MSSARPTIRWRPHTETPATDEPISALLAAGDPEANGEFFLIGIRLWRDGKWIDEGPYFRPVQCFEFWWVPEDELCATLPRKPRQRRRSR